MLFNKEIKIRNITIGENHPCFIIAEAGSNHNGDLEQAYKLIDIAKEANADAVKFQTFKAEKLYVKNAGKSAYLKKDKSIYDIIKEMEMPISWIKKLSDYCIKKEIIFLSTPFDYESVDLLDKYVPIYKIASYELTDIPLVEYIAKKNKPIIISTGASTLDEVQKALETVHNLGNNNIILMQCTAKYPAALTTLNLKILNKYQDEFNILVGLSDHSREFDLAPIIAVSLGSCCVEKHFTISNDLEGPDHMFALEPNELKDMVRRIRDTEKALGSENKIVLDDEKELYNFARRSIFALNDIRKGEIFTIDNIDVLRIGNNESFLSPKEFESVIGKHSKVDIKKYNPIKKEYYV